ncbi:polymorphic toxin-type HINT domain-containing protein [Saccharibacillus sacchari]|uniref:Polymorphic toxin-type HINT domain-containing protein n=1 Tax=Saccharibacillus sacchari TaxID=456493 RepID=A0ACC6P862_9BACL
MSVETIIDSTIGAASIVSASKGNSSTKIRSCNCFTAETKVLTESGEKNIEDIEAGDMLLSKDERTGDVQYKAVTYTFNHDTEDIYNIHINSQTIRATFNRPFYVTNKGWIFVKDLKIGDLLVRSDGSTLKIDCIDLDHKRVKVYNMTVDEYHTYFVSDLGIWAHNSDCSITISNAAARVSKKLSPEAKKGYEAAIKGLETGNLTGLNAHPLSHNRKGQWAVDVKGTGRGRGDGRVIYTKEADGSINVVKVLTTHNDY